MGNGPFPKITQGKRKCLRLCQERLRLGIREDFLLGRISQPFNSINLHPHRFSKVNQFQLWMRTGISAEKSNVQAVSLC